MVSDTLNERFHVALKLVPEVAIQVVLIPTLAVEVDIREMQKRKTHGLLAWLLELRGGEEALNLNPL